MEKGSKKKITLDFLVNDEKLGSFAPKPRGDGLADFMNLKKLVSNQ